MAKKFSEIVIEGPFVLVKGFLTGFLYGGDSEFNYFFHKREGIRRETLGEFLKEVFDFENFVHVCIESRVIDKLSAAVQKSNPKIGLKIKSVKEISSASFDFRYEIFNKELSDKAAALFDNLPAGVKTENYKPVVTIRNDAVGIEGYAPEHAFIATGSGKVNGEFDSVMDCFLKIKKSDLDEVITCGEIKLIFE